MDQDHIGLPLTSLEPNFPKSARMTKFKTRPMRVHANNDNNKAPKDELVFSIAMRASRTCKACVQVTGHLFVAIGNLERELPLGTCLPEYSCTLLSAKK